MFEQTLQSGKEYVMFKLIKLHSVFHFTCWTTKLFIFMTFALCLMLSHASSAATITGTWSLTGSLNADRRYHTATILHDGRMLVAGCYGGGVLDSAELYDAVTCRWSVTSSLKTA